jgi:hypothetical protein
LHVVAQLERVVGKHRANAPRQLVFGADPHLDEHVIGGPGHGLGGHAAHRAGRADVEGMQHLVGKRLVGVGQEQVGEGIVDRRLVVRLLERRFQGRRCIGDGDQVGLRQEGHHGLAVVIELVGRTGPGLQHTQLVRPLHRHVVAHRIGQRRTQLAGVLDVDDRGEAHRSGPRQFGAGGLDQVDRTLLDQQGNARLFGRCGLGRRGGLGGGGGLGQHAAGQQQAGKR